MSVRISSRRQSARILPALLVAALGAGALGVIAGATASAAGQHPRPVAFAARKLSLNLSAKLQLVGHPGHVLNDRGTVSGTLSGTVSSRIVALSSTNGTGTFTFYSKSGNLSGSALTRGRVVGATVYFTGTATVTGGSGKWAHASGRNLQFSGTMDRQNFHVSERISGSISY
jgi:hypothetical protein